MTADVSNSDIKRIRIRTGLLTDLHDIDERHRIILDFIRSTQMSPMQKEV